MMSRRGINGHAGTTSPREGAAAATPGATRRGVEGPDGVDVTAAIPGVATGDVEARAEGDVSAATADEVEVAMARGASRGG